MKQRITRIARLDEIETTTIEYRMLNGDRCELKYKGEWVPAFQIESGKFYPTFIEFCAKHRWHRGLALARGLGGKLKLQCLSFLPTLIVDGDWFELANRNDAAIWCVADRGYVQEVKALFYMTRVVKKDDQLRMLDYAKKRRAEIDAMRAERETWKKRELTIEKSEVVARVKPETNVEAILKKGEKTLTRDILFGRTGLKVQQILFDNRPVSRLGRIWRWATKSLSLPLVLGCGLIAACVYVIIHLGWG